MTPAWRATCWWTAWWALPCTWCAPSISLLANVVVDYDSGLAGNLLVDRMVGATVHLVRPGKSLCRLVM